MVTSLSLKNIEVFDLLIDAHQRELAPQRNAVQNGWIQATLLSIN